MSDYGTTLADAARAYKSACSDRDAIGAALREADATVTSLADALTEADRRVATSMRLLRLVARHGPVEDWTQDWMKESA